MELQDLVLEMDKTNDFLNKIGGTRYEFYSEITGICKNYREFIRAVKREFVDPLAVINAIVSFLSDGGAEAIYQFDNEIFTLEFSIRQRSI